jgi:hypothetical protein
MESLSTMVDKKPATEAINDVGTSGTQTPATERVARPLTKLPKEERAEAWAQSRVAAELGVSQQAVAKWFDIPNTTSGKGNTPATAKPDDDQSIIRGRVYNRRKRLHGGERKASAQDGHLKQRTAEAVAAELGVSKNTIKNAVVCGFDSHPLGGKHAPSVPFTTPAIEAGIQFARDAAAIKASGEAVAYF